MRHIERSGGAAKNVGESWLAQVAGVLANEERADVDLHGKLPYSC